jgi:hypothetical protein
MKSENKVSVKSLVNSGSFEVIWADGPEAEGLELLPVQYEIELAEWFGYAMPESRSSKTVSFKGGK